MNNEMDALPQHDLDILRRLAERKASISQDPVNQERRKAWYALDSGTNDRVMVLAEHGGIMDKKKPLSADNLECTNEWARGLEHSLRNEIYLFEELKDDHVVEPFINTNWNVNSTDYGVETITHRGGDENQMGSYRWDPPITDLDRDFHKLKPRTFSVDRQSTMKYKAQLENVFDSILPVRIKGSYYWTLGMTGQAIQFIGLEQLMIAMYDNPEGLHRIMTFLRDDHLNFVNWLEKENLYSFNNENDYIGSGSMGYTSDLPRDKDASDDHIKTNNLWVLLESQETVGVGPDQFEEFIFPYQLSIAKRFGKTYYGCCEPVHTRWHILKRIPNLARISVSPWADEKFMAEATGRDYVFSRKPNPSMISTSIFDENAIRADIRKTLDVAQHCRLEIIMKDVHTLNNEPERLARWVQIAREEIAKLN